MRELRAIARRIAALTLEKTRELNRQHAAGASADTPAVVANDVAVNVRHLQRRIDELERHALTLITATPELKPVYQRLLSVCGIADTTAIQLLGELLVLPADMTRAAVGGPQRPRRAPRRAPAPRSTRRPASPSRATPTCAASSTCRRWSPLSMSRMSAPSTNSSWPPAKNRCKPSWPSCASFSMPSTGMLKTNTDFDGSKFRKLPEAA